MDLPENRPWRRSQSQHPVPPGHPTAVFFLRCGYLALVILLGNAVRLALILQSPVLRGADDALAGQYVNQERLLSLLSDSLSQGSDLLFEYVSDNSSDRDASFEHGLSSLRSNAAVLVAQLQTLNRNPNTLGDLQADFSFYWASVDKARAAAARTRTLRWAQRFVIAESNRRALSELIRQRIYSIRASLRASQSASADAVRRQRSQLFLLLLACLISSIVLGCASIIYSSKAHLERRSKCEESVRSENQLARLSARLLTIQENERKLLSRELHDGIGQILTALRMEISYVESLGKVSDAVIYDRLARARGLADEAVRTVRNVSLLLRPVLLDDLGLEPALRWQIEDFRRRTNIPCEFHCAKLDDDLDDSYKTCVYRVVQESLNNCQKHASPSRVTISVELDGEQLLLRVEDDGCGFLVDDSSPSFRNAGLGILGMRERAAIFGGSLRIQSALGRGTLVTMSLNLNESHAPPDTIERKKLYANSDPVG
jgi:signal transduction histidine kinase